MTVQELHDALTVLYPRTLSCAWDNDGIMVSRDPGVAVRRILVALDATGATLDYAVQNDFDCVVTHHPMLFRGVKSVTPMSCSGRKILDCAAAGVSVLSFHTRLDAGEGGVNDCLCRAIGLTPRASFGDVDAPTLGRLADCDMSGDELIARVKASLGAPAVRVSGHSDKPIRSVAFCGGDGKDFVMPALAAGADAYITGDAGYNMAEDAAEDGLLTIEVGHYHSEAPVLAPFADQIEAICGIRPILYDSCAYRVFCAYENDKNTL